MKAELIRAEMPPSRTVCGAGSYTSNCNGAGVGVACNGTTGAPACTRTSTTA